MRHFRLLAVAALATAATAAVPQAQAFTPRFSGTLCSVTDDPAGSVPGQRSVIVRGGPFAGVDTDSPTDVAEVYVFCTLQVGGTGLASDPDVAEVDAEGDGAAMVAPTRVSFPAAETDSVVACTEIWVLDGSGHFSVYVDARSGAGTDSPSEAHCTDGVAITVPLPLP